MLLILFYTALDLFGPNMPDYTTTAVFFLIKKKNPYRIKKIWSYLYHHLILKLNVLGR